METADPKPAADELLPGRGGPLGSLARTWSGGVPSLQVFLEDLAGELGVQVLEWLPAGGGAGAAWPFHRPRSVEWPLAEGLAPAEVRLIGGEDRRRAPRLAAGAGREFYVRTGPGVERGGLLRVVAARALPLGRAALVALAELVARVARATEDPEDALAALRERALGRQAAALTHDLRNQLTLALLQLERLRAQEQGGLGLDALEDVLRSAHELCAAGLTGTAAPAPRPLVLRSVLLEEARRASAVSRGGSPVHVRARCPLELRVHADLALLRRLVHNLVVNACEASDAGAEVRVEGLRLPDGRVAVVVEDEGRGMGRSRLEALLAPGHTSGGGTGYGGASLVECLTGLGAECVVESAPGEGTRFEVHLDVAAPEDAPSVVLVDPDPVRRRRRQAALRAGGVEVTAVEDAAAAMAAVRDEAVGEVLVARGAGGARLEALRARVLRTGVLLRTLDATV